MYAVEETTHTLISLSDSAIAKVKARKAKCKMKFKNVFYRCVIGAQKVSFVETYEEAQTVLYMLHLHGDQS